jgi:alpha-glucosidase
MPPGWDDFAVDAQEGSAESMLVFYKRVIALRRPLFRMLPDELSWRAAPEGVLTYERGRLTVAVNFLSRPTQLPGRGRLLIASHSLAKCRNGTLTLPPNSGAWIDRLGGTGL